MSKRSSDNAKSVGRNGVKNPTNNSTAREGIKRAENEDERKAKQERKAEEQKAERIAEVLNDLEERGTIEATENNGVTKFSFPAE